MALKIHCKVFYFDVQREPVRETLLFSEMLSSILDFILFINTAFAFLHKAYKHNKHSWKITLCSRECATLNKAYEIYFGGEYSTKQLVKVTMAAILDLDFEPFLGNWSWIKWVLHVIFLLFPRHTYEQFEYFHWTTKDLLCKKILNAVMLGERYIDTTNF